MRRTRKRGRETEKEEKHVENGKFRKNELCGMRTEWLSGPAVGLSASRISWI